MDKRRLHPPEVSDASEVLHLKLWEGTIFDYPFGGYTGTLSGSTGTPVSSPPGFDFIAANTQYIDIGTGPTSVKTVTLWVKPNAINVTDYPIDLNLNFLSIVNGVLTKGGFSGGTNVLYVDGAVATAITANWHLIGITSTTARNASGLSIARATADLGSEKVENATLLESGGGWTYGNFWEDSVAQANAANHTQVGYGGNDILSATMITNIIATHKYRVTTEFDNLTVTDGAVVVFLGGVGNEASQGANSWDVTATNTNALTVQVLSDGVQTTDVILDEVSVKEIIPPTTSYFDGAISDVRLYSLVRTTANIRDLYEQTRWRYGV